MVPCYVPAHSRTQGEPLKKTLMKANAATPYESAVRLFFFWLNANLPWPKNGDELNTWLCECGEIALEEDETRAPYANMNSGILRYEESLRQPFCSLVLWRLFLGAVTIVVGIDHLLRIAELLQIQTSPGTCMENHWC